MTFQGKTLNTLEHMMLPVDFHSWIAICRRWRDLSGHVYLQRSDHLNNDHQIYIRHTHNQPSRLLKGNDLYPKEYHIGFLVEKTENTIHLFLRCILRFFLSKLWTIK